MSIIIILSIAYAAVLFRFPCKVGLHKWDQPDGHCEDCGKCDDFFGTHHHNPQNEGRNY